MKKKNNHKNYLFGHPLLNILLFKLSLKHYKAAYATQIAQSYYEAKGLPKYSLIDAMLDHIYGRKYYCVLISYPNQRVKGSGGLPIYETSTSIFFSEEEAQTFYEEFHAHNAATYINTHQIISFRSHCKIPVWSGYRDNHRSQIY